MVKYNVNYYMYIKITDYGKKSIINKYGYSFFENYIERAKQDNGYYRLQCHEIMSIFGEFLSDSFRIPFEPTVYFDESAIEHNC